MSSIFKNLRLRIIQLRAFSPLAHRRPPRSLVATTVSLAAITLVITSCDKAPDEVEERLELIEIDRKIHEGEITLRSVLADLQPPEIDPAMTMPAAAADAATDSSADPQIYITSKFVESETKLAADLPTYAVMSEAKFRMLMRVLNRQKGVDLLSAPSVLARNAQTAKIEVVQAIALPTAPDIHNNKSDAEITETVNIGVILEVTPTVRRGQIYLVGKATIRVPDRRESEATQTSSIDVISPNGSPTQGVLSFNTVETYFSAPVEPGATLLLNCRQTEKHKGSLLIMLTAKLLDEKGAELQP